ncbi:hypothetical protein ACHAWU_007366 [Discostella pseudostelligera]|uniref:BED-type domain-containing protein n=1 Tax=Discostella pseudostelligera TaxID=259834 RepID=A0ABD3MGX2_9STRA
MMSFGGSSVSTSSISVDETVAKVPIKTGTDWKLVKPPGNTRSPYWPYFLKFDVNVHKNKEDVVVCKLCLDADKHLEFSTRDGNTSSMGGHIKNFHLSIYDSIQQRKKKSDQSNCSQEGSEVKTTKSTITSFLKPKRTTEVVKHLFITAATASIIDNAFALSVVEKPSFRRMFLPLNKDAERMVNITSKTIRTSILNMGRMAKAATILDLTDKKLSYTLDHWTGPNNWTYGAVTGHHIDPVSWKMCSSLLDFKLFVGRTTGELIFKDISKVLSQFNRAESMLLADVDNETYSTPTTTAENNVIGVTDTTGNMGKLGEYLRDNGQEHAYCFGHIIHLVAGIAFDPNAKLLKFQSSSDIEEYANSRPKKLIQDVVTRWWSTYASIERALYLQKAIKGLIATSQVACEVLSNEEWKVLGEIESVLKPLAFFQSVLEGKSYVSGSLVPLAVFNIRRQLNDIVEDEEGTMDGVRKLAKALLDNFDIRYTPNKDDKNLLTFSWGAVVGFRKRYTTVHHYYFAAAFLDPRAKTLLKTFMTPVDWDLLKERIFDLMVNAAEKAVDDNVSPHKVTSDNARTVLVDTTAGSSAKAATVSQMFHVSSVKKSVTNKDAVDPNSVRNKCAVELSAFVDDGVWIPLNDADGDFLNPLDWWRDNSTKYPNLALLALEYLAIPATSAPSERVFSRAGRLLTMKRALLSPDIAERMMFIKDNADLLHKHYVTLRQQEVESSYDGFIEEERSLLPHYERPAKGKKGTQEEDNEDDDDGIVVIDDY